MRRVCAFAVACIGVVACSTTASTLDAGTCLLDASDYDASDSGLIPTGLNPPHAPEHACTTAQLSDYAQCQGAKDESLCKQFQTGGASTACSACMESQSTDATWGVVVFDAQQQTGSFNIEGCVDLALSQVGMELANKGAGSCGDLLHASYQCQNDAVAVLCLGCVGDAATCQQTVLTTACALQDAAVTNPAGPCASLFSEAASPTALACFPDPTISDPEAQLVAWLSTVGAVFCGP